MVKHFLKLISAFCLLLLVTNKTNAQWSVAASSPHLDGAGVSWNTRMVSITNYKGQPYLAFEQVDGYGSYGCSGHGLAQVKFMDGSNQLKYLSSLTGCTAIQSGVCDILDRSGYVTNLTICMVGSTPYIARTFCNGYSNPLDKDIVVTKFNGKDWITVGDSLHFICETNVSKFNGMIAAGTTTPFVVGSLGGYIYVKKLVGKKWVNVGDTIVNKGIYSNPQIAMDGDVPYISYNDVNKNGKITVKKLNGNSWVTLGASGLSYSNNTNVKLVIGSGIPYIAYSDSSSLSVSVKKFEGNTWVSFDSLKISLSFGPIQLAISGTTPYILTTTTGLEANVLDLFKYDGSKWIALDSVGLHSISEVSTHSTPSLTIGGSTPYIAFSPDYGSAGGDVKDQVVAVIKYTDPSLPKPEISSFNPTRATVGDTVTITGSGFTGTWAVTLGGVAAKSYTLVNSTTIKAVVPDEAWGSDINITADLGTGSVGGFTYYIPEPTITSFTPTTVGYFGTVYIYGTNFTDVTSVSFGNTPAYSFSVVSSTVIQANLNTGASGDVTVTTRGGTASLDGFTYYIPKPVIASFSPTSASTGKIVTIIGSNFINTTGVSFGGTAATSFTILNDNSITAVVANGASGDVTVTNKVGTTSLAGFTLLPTYTWTGTTSNNWNDASNWNDGKVPTNSKAVLIPSNAPHQIALDGNATAYSITIDGSLNLNGHSLSLIGALSGSGSIETSGSSTLSIGGSNNSIGSIKVDNGSLSLNGNTVSVTNQLTVSGGTLNTNDNLTLASTSTGSAIVNYPLGGTINGNLNIERYIPQDQGSAFRDLGVCVTGGKVADLSTQTYSYTNGNWSSKLGSTISLTPGVGYRAQVNTKSGSVTLGSKGSLVTGSVNTNLNGGTDNFSFIANPYQSQIDFNKITKDGLYTGYWYLDPTTIYNGYQEYSYFGTDIGTSNIYTTTATQYIQPGQAFFVCSNTTGTPTLTFKESDIDNTHSQINVFGVSKPLNRIATGLFKAGKNIDGAVSVFNSNFSNEVAKEDGFKFSNNGENLTFKVAGKDLCANGWNLPTTKDELQLHLYKLNLNTDYSLRLDASQFVGNGLQAYLKDNVRGTKTLLVGDSNIVTFNTATDTASYSSRYTIVFAASTLPINSINLTATELSNNQVALKWNVIGESNVSNYQVERSNDGKSFASLATISHGNASNYSYNDIVSDIHYYRIKAIDKTSAILYSNVVSIKNQEFGITVFPNPVIGNSFKLGLNKSGKYIVDLVNVMGKTVFTTTVNHVSTSSVESIDLGKKLATGNYTIKTIDEKGKISTKQVFIK